MNGKTLITLQMIRDLINESGISAFTIMVNCENSREAHEVCKQFPDCEVKVNMMQVSIRKINN